jgi:hypothetical protein
VSCARLANGTRRLPSGDSADVAVDFIISHSNSFNKFSLCVSEFAPA